MKNFWNMNTLYIAAAIIALSAFILPRVIEAVNLHVHGISHIAEQTEDYFKITEPVEGEYSVEIDLSDLKSNEGKILFDDGDNAITVLEVVPHHESGYEVAFRSHGSELADGAALVSGVAHDYTDKGFLHSLEAEATASIDGGQSIELASAGNSGLSYRDGERFGFTLDVPLDSETVRITLSKLQLNLWVENWWS